MQETNSIANIENNFFIVVLLIINCFALSNWKLNRREGNSYIRDITKV
jgi:hypothetical protein